MRNAFGDILFDGSDPIRVLDFLAEYVDECDYMRISEDVALISLPKFLEGVAHLFWRSTAIFKMPRKSSDPVARGRVPDSLKVPTKVLLNVDRWYQANPTPDIGEVAEEDAMHGEGIRASQKAKKKTRKRLGWTKKPARSHRVTVYEEEPPSEEAVENFEEESNTTDFAEYSESDNNLAVKVARTTTSRQGWQAIFKPEIRMTSFLCTARKV